MMTVATSATINIDPPLINATKEHYYETRPYTIQELYRYEENYKEDYDKYLSKGQVDPTWCRQYRYVCWGIFKGNCRRSTNNQ